MKFIVPVYWTMMGLLVIEADSKEEAALRAEDAEFPSDAEYMDGSYEINEDAVEVLEEDAPDPETTIEYQTGTEEAKS